MNKHTIGLTAVFIGICSVSFSQNFKLQFTQEALDHAFSGKVIVYLSKTEQEPRLRDHWTQLPAVFSVPVRNVKHGEWIIIASDHQSSFPVPPSQIERGSYYAQLVFDRAELPTDRAVGTSAGNMVSEPVRITITENKKQTYTLTATKRLPRLVFESTRHYRAISVRSKLLSDFYNEETTLFGVVALPDTLLENPTLRLPLIVHIQGFGGDYKYLSGKDWSIRDHPYIELLLDGNCRTGHHVFANSANNGPWGDALITELIPEVERQFACTGQRFVTGHSSGGWSALWLQLQYPKVFDGCWASSPDYVSFKHFQGVNIYKAKNFFTDSLNNLTPYALIGGWSPIMFNKYESKYEEVVRGEQLASFEAVFGPRSQSGAIVPLWNRQSGAIDYQVAEHWHKYDILEFLKQNYATLSNDLKSKIMITCGTEDNFMLDVPIRELREMIKSKNWEMSVRLVPGDHFTLDMRRLQSDWISFVNERIGKLKYQISK